MNNTVFTSMDKSIYLLVLLFILLVVYPLIFKKTRHQKKRIAADKIIETISKIEHPGQKIAYLRKVDPYAFEELILTLLQRKGFVIARNKKYSGDGGIDGRFEHNKEMWFIQAKRYSNRIKLEHVNAFAQVLRENKCHGIFVHTGTTPSSILKAARATGSKNRIEIISGGRLLDLFDTTKKGKF